MELPGENCSSTEILDMLEKIKNYSMKKNVQLMNHTHCSISLMEEQMLVERSARKQSSIADFFKVGTK